MNPPRTLENVPKIADLGEDELIALFSPRLPQTSAAILGPGDDAAVLSLTGDLVVSSDVLVEDQHFRAEWSTGADVGFRAATQNLADIDAMGAVPVAMQVTLALPASTQVAWVLELADGLREACEPHGVGVIGGDLSSAKEIAVSVTVLGDTMGRRVVRRSGANLGDIVAVSGPLGAAVAGYHQLSNMLDVDSETINLFLRPRPRVGAGLEASSANATAMMDISDGLLVDAARIARSSDVGIWIDSAAVPIHRGVVHVADEVIGNAREWALTGGEDHQLIATFPPKQALPSGWVSVGRCTRNHDGVLVDGKVPASLGWDHFAHV